MADFFAAGFLVAGRLAVFAAFRGVDSAADLADDLADDSGAGLADAAASSTAGRRPSRATV